MLEKVRSYISTAGMRASLIHEDPEERREKLIKLFESKPQDAATESEAGQQPASSTEVAIEGKGMIP